MNEHWLRKLYLNGLTENLNPNICKLVHLIKWKKTEFYSDLKQSAVNNNDYENSKYQTLKMRHLGDLNDLYNVPDVILLSEIIENHFGVMHKFIASILESVTQLVQ